NPGWAWEDVLPHFKAFETFAGGDRDWRGMKGELNVIDMTPNVHPLCQTWLKAAEQAGYERTPDYNGEQQEGVAVYQITNRGGLRESAATAFLKPAMRRPNLTVVTDALATKLVFEGRKAIGVEYLAGGRTVTARAGREVIVAAGAVNSPTLLQHSGL